MIIKCSCCKLVKSTTEFYKNRSKKDGFTTECKLCNRMNCKKYKRTPRGKVADSRGGAKYRASVKGKITARTWKLKTVYGIPFDDYNRMFTEQNGCCAICGKHQSEFSNRLNVDHDHKTGVVRGLLCVACNTRLGQYEVIISENFAAKARWYLKNPKTD